MFRTLLARLFAVAIASGLSCAVHPADGPVPTPAKKMKMAAPMTSGMAKKGMMKGDVKSAADKKHQTMQPMMEQEQQAMPPAGSQK